MSPGDDRPLDVDAGDGYVLEVGRPSGMQVECTGAAPRSAQLHRAVEEAEVAEERERRRGGRAPAPPAGDADDAGSVTERVHAAAGLFERLRDGTLDAGAALEATDELVDALRRLDRAGRWADVIRLGRELHRVLAVARRWRETIESLWVVERAARHSGDDAATAAACHDRGVLELVAGRRGEADRLLTDARDLRVQIGDGVGAAATRRAMQSLCEALRREARHADRSRRRRPSRALVAGGLVLLVLMGVVLGALFAPLPSEAVGESKVTVVVDGRGTVRSTPALLECRARCTETFEEGVTAALAAVPDPGHELVAWRGGICSGTVACAVEPGTSGAVIAAFAPRSGRAPLAIAVVGDGEVEVRPGKRRCAAQCRFPVERDARVTLTAVRGGLVRWEGDCAGRDPCRLRMDGPRAVVGRFSRAASADGDGGAP